MIPVALGLAAALAAGPLRAAPIDAGELQPVLPALGTPASDGSAGAASPAPDGRTGAPDAVDMLLRLQQDVPARRSEPPRPAAGTMASARDGKDEGATPGTRLKALKSGLFGTDAEQADVLAPDAGRLVGSEEDVLAEGAREPMGTAAAPGFDHAAPHAPAAQPAGPSLLANPIVRFIRENRALSLGASLALLGAVWFTSTYRGRRSRRGRNRR